MKFSLIFFMLSALAVAIATPYVMKMASGQKTGLEDVFSVKVPEQTRKTFYKWQDASGQWHFGDEVPEGVATVAVEVDTAANIMKPFDIPEPEEKEVKPKAVESPELSAIPIITPERATEAFEKTDQVKALLENRDKQLQEQLNAMGR